VHALSLLGSDAPETVMSCADALLARLTGIRSTGSGRWFAQCPAHEDANPSLSIRELADGRVLLHCFAGCPTAEVLEALALDWVDLYPGRAPHRCTAPKRRPWTARYAPADLLEIVAEEVSVVAIIAADLLARRQIDVEDWQRLQLAASRTQRVRDYMHTGRMTS
jgi:hypothetical protein